MRPIPRALIGCLLLVHCGSGRHAAPAGPVRAPIPTREACLAAPWVLPDGPATAGAGLVRASCEGSDGRQAVFAREGARAASAEDLQPLFAALRERLTIPGDVQTEGIGVCCDRHIQPGEVCLRVSTNLCQTREEALVAAFGEVLAAAPADLGVRFSVHLDGAVRPRCAPPDRDCIPVPYSGGGEYDPDDDRTPIAEAFGERFARLSWGDCAHDGECVIAGCGNQCAPWTRTGPGTCEAYTNMEEAPAFCGCVEGTCTWFVQ